MLTAFSTANCRRGLGERRKHGVGAGKTGPQLQRAHRVSTDFASNMRRHLVAKSRPMAVTNRCAAVSVVTARAPRRGSAARARSVARSRAHHTET